MIRWRVSPVFSIRFRNSDWRIVRLRFEYPPKVGSRSQRRKLIRGIISGRASHSDRDPRVRDGVEHVSERELPVFLYAKHIGDLVADDRGLVKFRWSEAAAAQWPAGSTILSRSLRQGSSTAESTAAFFGGLLPEGRNRELLDPTGDLIRAFEQVGADLAGALQIGTTQSTEPQPLIERDLDALLRSASGFLVGGGGHALAGFQPKIGMTRVDGRWIRGNGALASTHILKPARAANRRVVENENYALAAARALGLLNFESWVEDIGGWVVLVVERYDRTATGRIHQEDTAQALGLPSGGDTKFERVDARASLRNVAGLLDSRDDLAQLLRYATFNVAVGNTDAHAKNFSLIHRDDGTTSLAPLYDIAPLALEYEASQVMAMTVNDVRRLEDVAAADLVTEAHAWGLDHSVAQPIVEEVLHSLTELTRTLDAHPSIAAHTPGYIHGQAKNLLDGKRARITSSIPLVLQKSIGIPGGFGG